MLVALTLTLVVPTLAAQAKQGTILSHRMWKEREESAAKVRHSANTLAAALRRELGSSDLTPAYVLAARDRLGQEADLLEKNDPHMASHLRSFAQEARPTILLMPVYADYADDTTGADSQVVSSSSSSDSQKTVYQNGQMVTITTHCENGNCVQKKVAGASKAPKLLDVEDGLTKGSDEASVSDAARDLADSLRDAEEVFGHHSLGNIMRPGLIFPSDHFFDSDPLFDDMHFDDMQKLRTDHDAKSYAAKTHGKSVSITESMDANGNLVKRTETCTDGACTTQVVEAAPGSKMEKSMPQAAGTVEKKDPKDDPNYMTVLLEHQKKA